MGALIGFIGGFITGQIFLICVAVIVVQAEKIRKHRLKKSGNRRTKS